ncbi:E3 ubiquitin-protein ligase PRT1-like isoform X3 [Asparagus officinalis]|uniref:E3 ubiquitin-protein ligase PRT1-like isoform X3 n=1 Tax=Asparagus officinalis TaxID=4686 RepID=UPI00098E5609|nr:E3 ubiquitin-protein ligase PRT1-like isoform X3 [Asparagus officinalis]
MDDTETATNSAPPPNPNPLKNEQTLDGDGDVSYPSYFQCCVCLDLLYKPIVLACGHISCFWCVHRAMHGLRASHCAVCRQPYVHFPGICQLLHHLLLKMEPVAYKRREVEVLEEEKRLNVFSPQFENSMITEDSDASEEIQKSTEDLKASKVITSKEPCPPETGPEIGKHKQVSVDDVLCELCKELLFQPSVLNCGHVFCDTCLSDLANGPLLCPACQSPHPGGFPNVCLDLDHFLEEQFPTKYAVRKEKAQLKRVEWRLRESSSSSLQEGKKAEPHDLKDDPLFLEEDLRNVHIGVGCDTCGMYPITGKRYRCKDCKEEIGFDLCETCYNSSSKLPGRFNQRHTPDHEFEVDKSQMLCSILFRSFVDDLQQEGSVIFLPDDHPHDHGDADDDDDADENNNGATE